MNITNYRLLLEDDFKTIQLKYYGNENIVIEKKDANEDIFITVPRMVLQKFMDLIDES